MIQKYFTILGMVGAPVKIIGELRVTCCFISINVYIRYDFRKRKKKKNKIFKIILIIYSYIFLKLYNHN